MEQLYKKQNGQYIKVYPLNYIENILDSESGKTLASILSNFNNISLPYQDNARDTRALVPQVLRRKGLWITYNNGEDYVTEYYKGTASDIQEHWTDDYNWEVVPSLKYVQENAGKLPDGIITPSKLSPALLELIRQNNTITNLPDDEDLEEFNSVLRFKDRSYQPELASGKGYKILRKNWTKVGDKTINLLTQNMINEPNTRYIIQYDFDLNEQEITIPEGCILKFEGGSFSNGTLKNPYIIKGDFEKLNCNITGSYSFIPNQVSYSQFGAKLDGINDDYYFIKKCHDFANKYNLNVVQQYGNIFISNKNTESIEIRTNTDISKCTFIINNFSFIKHPYKITENEDNKSIDITDIYNNNKTEFKFKTSSIPCLKSIGAAIFLISSSNKILGIRPPGDNYYCAEPFTIYQEGEIIDGSLYCDYTDNDCIAKLIYKRIDTEPICFKMPNIYLQGTNGNPEYLFLIERNNSNIILPNSIKYSKDYLEPITTRYIMKLSFTYGVNIYGSSKNALKNIGYTIGGNNRSSNYITAASYSTLITYDGLVMYNGWGAHNTEFIKTVTFKNSICNRFDNHFGVSDITIRNCTFIGNAGKINIGYGDGNVIIENINVYSYIGNTQNTTCILVDFRCDLRLFYRGDVLIRNIKCQNNIPLILLQLYNLYSNSPSVSSVLSENKIGNIRFENIIVKNDANAIYGAIILNGHDAFPLNIKSIKFSDITADKFILFNQLNIENQNNSIENIKVINTNVLSYGVSDSNLIINMFISNDKIYKFLPNLSNKMIFDNCNIKYASDSSTNERILLNCKVQPVPNSSNTLLQLKAIDIFMFNCLITNEDYENLNEFAFIINGNNSIFIGNKLDKLLNPVITYEEDNKKLAFYITKDLFSSKLSKNSPLFDTLVSFDKDTNKFVSVNNDELYYSSTSSSGNTTSRPSNPTTGYQYFDTDLNKPIYWTGSKWVDATGEDV